MSDLPSCFGKQWESNDPQCAGGRDPAYTDPVTGSHIRERCAYYSACGTRVQVARSTSSTSSTPQPTQLVPAQNLTRPVWGVQQRQQPPPATPATTPTANTSPVPAQVLAQYPWMQAFMQQMMQQPPAQPQLPPIQNWDGAMQHFVQALAHHLHGAPQGYGPIPMQGRPAQPTAFVPPNAVYGQAPMMPVNFMMPGYLSVPEVRRPGDSLLGLLGREVARSLFKAGGHTVANFFDFTTWGPPGG